MIMLSLLCGANPLHCKRGPSVRLQAGRWRLLHDGVIDSILTLVLESSSERISAQHEVEFVLERSEIVWLEFAGKGSEKYITVNARRVA